MSYAETLNLDSKYVNTVGIKEAIVTNDLVEGILVGVSNPRQTDEALNEIVALGTKNSLFDPNVTYEVLYLALKAVREKRT